MNIKPNTSDLLAHYDRRVADGELEPDAAQRQAASALTNLASALQAWRGQRSGFLALLTRSHPPSPRGLYIHGGVGRGKTMLMDLFYETVDFSPKIRLHFHEFMASVHDRIAKARHAVDGDPIPFVAADIAADAGLVCSDELQVTDIADAMILSRLFRGLFERGVVFVTTSNAAPRALYRHGLNRALFLPFVDLIEEEMDVLELVAAKDFRLDKLSGLPLYFTPATSFARQELDRHWQRLTGGHPSEPKTIEVKGRRIVVPLASMGVARFTFDELCEAPLGAIDYLHIAHTFHTLIVDDIPLLTPERRNAARRLVTLIDTLYDNRNCLIASAAAEPDRLYPKGDGADLFLRTASRLTEMRSEAYLARFPRLS